MASKTALNCAAVQIFGFLDGQQVMNDLYYQFASQPTHVELVELCASIAAVVVENWLPLLPNSWVGRSVFAYDMTVPDGANAVDDSIAGEVGLDSGTPAPNQVTLAVARKNGLRGRSGNGRIFWMGLAGSDFADQNTILPIVAEHIISAIKTADAAAEGLDWTPVNLSFQTGNVVSTAATIYPITDWVVTDFRVDTRRSRLPRGGA